MGTLNSLYLCCSHFQGCGICLHYTSLRVQKLTLLGQDFFSLNGHKLFVYYNRCDCDIRK